MKKKMLLFLISTLCSGIFYAQKQGSSLLALEIDPAPYFLKGYSVSLKYSSSLKQEWAVMASIYQSDFPDAMMSKTNRSNGWTDMKMDKSYALFLEYFLKDTRKGWYAGPAIFWYNKSAGKEESAERIQFSTIYPNLRVGYIWYPFKAFDLYVNPWFNAGCEINLDDSNHINGITFEPNQFQYILAIHIGYSFGF